VITLFFVQINLPYARQLYFSRFKGHMSTTAKRIRSSDGMTSGEGCSSLWYRGIIKADNSCPSVALSLLTAIGQI
jgi:hypothetical protein